MIPLIITVSTITSIVTYLIIRAFESKRNQRYTKPLTFLGAEVSPEILAALNDEAPYSSLA